MYQEITLDCSMLESPEPLNLIIKNLEKIDEKTYIKMIHRMEPSMLYGILNTNNFMYKVIHKNNQVIVYIFKDSKIQEYLKCM